ncbi:MAG: LacI family DNA-binding transcriptional regulator [Chloroflexi bacterium]|nr:LacI family DNA-binding transcriptional regulator [Chloroflexota bacterium]
MGQRVTLGDIARQSNVSLATVSLVLRDKPGINEETRQRVLDVARGLGYRSRPQAEFLLTHNLQQVGLLMKAQAGEPPYSNPFYGHVIAGIEAACRRQQINLLFAAVPVDEDNHPEELPRMLLEGELNGLLLVGAFVDSTITRLLDRHRTWTVLVDAYAADNHYDSVVSDNFRGAYDAVAYLIERGHRKIGLVGSRPEAYPSIGGRRRGYLQALHDYGIAEPYFADSHMSSHESAEAVTDLLKRSPEVTALFCCNDQVAIAAMQAAQALDRSVPNDLSIIGFDNIDLAAHVTPALTTMHIDKVSMGRLAVQLLLDRAEFPSRNSVTTALRPTLIERASVRSLPPN